MKESYAKGYYSIHIAGQGRRLMFGSFSGKSHWELVFDLVINVVNPRGGGEDSSRDKICGFEP